MALTALADRLDPRSKLVFVIAIVVIAIGLPKLRSLGSLLLVLFVTVIVTGPAVRRWLGLLSAFAYLIPLLFVLNLFFYADGRTIWAISTPIIPLEVTTGGIHTSLVILLRLLTIAGAAAWFATTTEAERFETALVELGVPWKLAFTASLTVRLVPVMRRRFRSVEEAQRSRGLVIKGGPLARARARIPMFIPFLAGVIQYGYDLSEALTARDFDRNQSRTTLITLSYGAADYVTYLLAVGLIGGFVLLFA
ncbi:MAG: energy-coupling factor transporter transmembrane component T [Halobacteriales archaeon]